MAEQLFFIVKIQRMGKKRKILHKDLTRAVADELIKQYQPSKFYTFAIQEQLFKPGTPCTS